MRFEFSALLLLESQSLSFSVMCVCVKYNFWKMTKNEMKRHFKCGEKPFQKRVEDMVKNLEALFKQDDSWTAKEIIFCGVFCILIGLILIYAGYSFVNWYSDTSVTQFEQCCCACGGHCYRQKSYKKTSRTVFYFCKGFVQGFVSTVFYLSPLILMFWL